MPASLGLAGEGEGVGEFLSEAVIGGSADDSTPSIE
jgi:hypothetical protein